MKLFHVKKFKEKQKYFDYKKKRIYGTPGIKETWSAQG